MSPRRCSVGAGSGPAIIGLILIPLARHVSDGRAIGVEPVPVKVARLRDAVSLNTALGVTDIHASSSGNAIPTNASDPHATVVELTTVDDLSTTLSFDRLDTIKMMSKSLRWTCLLNSTNHGRRRRLGTWCWYRRNTSPRS